MIWVDFIDDEKYFTATYYMQSKKSLRDAAWNLAIGQSVGNPNVRSERETDELFENHSCVILNNPDLESTSGIVKIGFPMANIDLHTDGVSQLLCFLMGGQLDIDTIEKCHLLDLHLPEKFTKNKFLGPKFGIEGIRNFTQVHNKPLLGGIIKPKTGISPQILLDMVKELVDGGVNFIKEDEIMSNPFVNRLEDRVDLISNYLSDKKVVYCFCINADPMHILDRVKLVHKAGGNGVHVNFWSGMGVYKSIRELDLPIFMHFQKSGDKILTNSKHDFHIDWKVICKLAGLMGVDFIHAGMWGGYSDYSEEELKLIMATLHQNGVMPALSCGMQPGLVDAVSKRFGNNYLANCGGSLHGHPGGAFSGARAMRQAIDKVYGEEYFQAIDKWGKID